VEFWLVYALVYDEFDVVVLIVGEMSRIVGLFV